MVRRLKRFVYETVIPAPGSSRIWSQLQVREPGAANLELAGSSSVQSSSDLQIPRQPSEAPIQSVHPGKETTRSSIEEVNTAIEQLSSIEVSQYKIFLPHLIEFFRLEVSSFKAGRIAQYLDTWENITTDSEILTSVSGKMIPFTSILRFKIPSPFNQNGRV